MPRWGKKKFSRRPGRHLSIWKNQQLSLMVHKAWKHQKRNWKIRDRNPSQADKINTVSRTCVHTPALGLKSTPAGCRAACATAAVHRNARCLRGAVWKQRLPMQEALAGSVGRSGHGARPSSPSARGDREEEVVAVHLLLRCGSAFLGWTDPGVGVFGKRRGQQCNQRISFFEGLYFCCCGWPACVNVLRTVA